MDQAIRTSYAHDIFQKASYRRPSFLYPTLPSTTNHGWGSPSNPECAEGRQISQNGILTSRALLTPPSSDVGTIRHCGSANDSDPASTKHTNDRRQSPPSPRASREHFEWPSTQTNRPLLSSRNPRCYGLDGSLTLNPSIESYTFPPTGNTKDRSTTISTSDSSSSLNEMAFLPPPPYSRTPPPLEDFTEALVEHVHHRPTTAMRKPSVGMPNIDCPNALGLYSATHLPTPSPSPPSSLADLPTETSSTSESEPKRRRLRITIPETPTPCGLRSPPRPVTALYYPQSGAGDICASPPYASDSYQEPSYNGDHASVTSYDERPFAPRSKSVRFSAETVEYSPQYSPQSPPRLARWSCVPLPPEYSPEEPTDSLVDASFAMLTLHDDDCNIHLGLVHDPVEGKVKEQLLPVANLPHNMGANLLSPLPLATAPSYRLEDLRGQISHCMDSTDRIYLTLGASPAISESDAVNVCAALKSVLRGLKTEASRPAPDLELLAQVHGAEWRRKYERVVMSLGRNLDRCIRAADEASTRSQYSRYLVSLKDSLSCFTRKLEDLRHRLEVFQDHIFLLEKRAEYHELTAAVRAEKKAEQANRQRFKIATEEIEARRHALKEQIRKEEEAARIRWKRARLG